MKIMKIIKIIKRDLRVIINVTMMVLCNAHVIIENDRARSRLYNEPLELDNN